MNALLCSALILLVAPTCLAEKFVPIDNFDAVIVTTPSNGVREPNTNCRNLLLG